MRVVSLVPSITETLVEWGVPVVACTRFCEQPALPHVGGTKDPDIDAIVVLAPDLVVLDREENRREDADALVAAGMSIHVTHVVNVGDVEPTLGELSRAVQARRRVPAAPPAGDGGLDDDDPIGASAFVPIWRRPAMSLNDCTYGSSLLAALGVRNVFGDHPDTYPEVELANVAALGPDLVLLPSEPYPFAERHRSEYERALPGARAVLVDGRDLFWWGVRTAGAMRRLRAVLRAATRPS